MLEYSIIFIEEIIIYCMLLKIIYREKLRRKWIMGLMFGFFCVLMCVNMRKYAIFIMLAVVITGFGFMIEATILEKIKKLSVISITFLILGEMVYTFMKLLNLNIYTDNREFVQSYAVIIFGLAIILAILGKRGVRKRIENVLGKKFLVYIIVFFTELVLLMSVTLVQFAVSFVPNAKFEKFFDVVAFLGFICMGIVIALVLYIVDLNKKISNSLESEKKLREMQRIYYNALLKKEETRKFRHDISNHLICIQELAEKNNNVNVVDYIKKLENQLDNITKRVYYTGNNVVDILLNFYFSKINNNANVAVNGYVNEDVGISEPDMCTILSNLLKNAVEEVNQTDKESFIKIKFLQGRQFFSIEIENTMNPDISGKWKEEEKGNHGYGLKNVKEVVEQNNGNLEIEQNGEVFIVKVMFEVPDNQFV